MFFLFSLETIQLAFLLFFYTIKLLQDVTQIMYYKNLNREDLWLDCAEKLTNMIQNIIEFAKLIPGFMRLSQDDQVSHTHDSDRPPFILLVISFSFFPRTDSLVKDWLLWISNHTNVPFNGLVTKLCVVWGSDAVTRCLLYLRLVRDEVSCEYIWDCKGYCCAKVDRNGVGTVSEFGVIVAR